MRSAPAAMRKVAHWAAELLRVQTWMLTQLVEAAIRRFLH